MVNITKEMMLEAAMDSERANTMDLTMYGQRVPWKPYMEHPNKKMSEKGPLKSAHSDFKTTFKI